MRLLGRVTFMLKVEFYEGHILSQNELLVEGLQILFSFSSFPVVFLSLFPLFLSTSNSLIFCHSLLFSFITFSWSFLPALGMPVNRMIKHSVLD